MNTESPHSNPWFFAGGGSRCLWQCGFWEEAAPRLGLAPKVLTGASAGSTMACIVIAGRSNFALEYMKKATAANPRNVYPLNIFSRRRIFPHGDIYRRAILATLDRAAFQRLMEGPDLRVVVARPPGWTGARTAVLLGLACYALENSFSPSVHPALAGKAGFKAEVISVRQCRTSEEVTDLLLASSCSPPLIPIMRRNGKVVLDGGLVDNVPVCALDPEPGQTLVLLSKVYPKKHLPEVGGRIYVQPSRPVGVTKWDYTSPHGLQAAFDLGRADGERFAAQYRP